MSVDSAVVTYRVRTRVGGEGVGESSEPLELRFGRVGVSEGPFEELEIAGRVHRCEVREEQGLRVYRVVDADGAPRFPGVVKVTQGDEVLWLLSGATAE